jgi:hypothetical protein
MVLIWEVEVVDSRSLVFIVTSADTSFRSLASAEKHLIR